MPKQILLVEDDVSIVELIEQNAGSDFRVMSANNGRIGLEKALSEEFAAIVLDIQLPELSGTEVCKRIRSANIETPIVMLTGKGSVFDTVLGLELGADDYVSKPFDPLELFIRINTIIKRRNLAQVPDTSSRDNFNLGGLKIDFAKKQVLVDGQEVVLTSTEFHVLEILVVRAGSVVSKEEMLNIIWGTADDSNSSVVSTHLNRMRRKLSSDTQKYIETVWGVGFRIKNEDEL